MIKITTWNVNGIRSALNKGALNWINEFSPDIVCLQEVRAFPEQLLGMDEHLFTAYETIWHPATKPGYSGVMTMSLQNPEFHQIGLGVPDYDSEGRVIFQRYEDLIIFNVYFPSGRRGHERVAYKLNFYSDLLKLITEYHNQGELLIITGDFNTAHQEIDLKYPKNNQKTSGFLPEEREWIDRYLESGLVDAFRELYPRRIQYTWWTNRLNARQRNIGWRLDYFLVSKALLPRVNDVVIHDQVMGSDHCPVTLYLDDKGKV